MYDALVAEFVLKVIVEHDRAAPQMCNKGKIDCIRSSLRPVSRPVCPPSDESPVNAEHVSELKICADAARSTSNRE